MKRKNNRTNTRKPSAYPAYMKALYEAFKPLSRQVTTAWVRNFAGHLTRAISHMTEGVDNARPMKEGCPAEETRVTFDTGRIEALCLCLRRDEREAILDLVERVLMNTDEARDILKIIKSACHSLSWQRNPSIEYALREFVAENIEAKSEEQL